MKMLKMKISIKNFNLNIFYIFTLNMNEIFTSKDEIAKNVFVGDMCYTTFPCKHYFTTNGICKLTNGIEIYNYCVDNNIEIPEHFQMYKDYINKEKYIEMIKNNDFENFKNNYLLSKYGQHFLIYANKFNNIQIINYLLNDVNIIPNENIIEETTNLEIFKLLLSRGWVCSQGTPQHVNFNEIIKTDKCNNIIIQLIKNNCFDIIKYLFNTYEINLNNFKDSPLVEALKYNNKEIINIIIEKSINDDVFYYDNDAEILKGKNILNNYLFNYKAILNLTTNLLPNVFNTDKYNKYIYNLIYKKFNKSLELNFLNNEIQMFSLKKIKINFNNENIKDVKLIINNTNIIDFRKIDDNYVFESIDKISLYHLKLETLKILINFNKKTILNKVDINFDLINDFNRKKLKYDSYLINISNNEKYICYNQTLTKQTL